MPAYVAENFSITLPWRTGNQIELLVDGDQFFPRILGAIAEARLAIDIELYLFESGHLANRFISALSAAIERGIQVRLLLDYFGSYGLSQQDVLLMRERGFELRFFNRLQRRHLLRNLSRDHRKIITIDNQIAFVGGAGITDEFSPKAAGGLAWRELMVEIRGPIVSDWQVLFDRIWEHYDFVHREAFRERIRHHKPAVFNPHFMNREIAQARVNATRGPGNKPIMGALLSEIKKAHTLIWISTAYFYPSRKLLKLLRKAAQRGVDVRLLLPGPHTDHPGVRYAGRSLYRNLLKDNVRIYEYQPRFLHMKLALVDDWCSLGSCNFDRWNLRWNLEANLEVIDREFTHNVESMLVNDFAQSIEFNLEQWKKRGMLEKVRERMWEFVGIFLGRIRNQ